MGHDVEYQGWIRVIHPETLQPDIIEKFESFGCKYLGNNKFKAPLAECEKCYLEYYLPNIKEIIHFSITRGLIVNGIIHGIPISDYHIVIAIQNNTILCSPNARPKGEPYYRKSQRDFLEIIGRFDGYDNYEVNEDWSPKNNIPDYEWDMIFDYERFLSSSPEEKSEYLDDTRKISRPYCPVIDALAVTKSRNVLPLRLRIYQNDDVFSVATAFAKEYSLNDKAIDKIVDLFNQANDKKKTCRTAIVVR